MNHSERLAACVEALKAIIEQYQQAHWDMMLCPSYATSAAAAQAHKAAIMGWNALADIGVRVDHPVLGSPSSQAENIVTLN